MAPIVSDDRLARRAAGGDERALESIYQRYHQDLYRFCLAMTGNVQDAQEALQNTMLKILRALPGEERPIKLRPWLYRIARNEAVEVLRRRRDDDQLEADVPAPRTVAETAETRDRLRALLDDLEQLPERQRAALLMRELCGCDFAAIGESFGTTAAVARQTLYEARLGLRELEEGRERHCADVRRELSDCDGRVLRRRKLRAHLRDCPACRAFKEAIAERKRTLAGIAPLPLLASAGLLQTVLGVGQGAGQAVATSAALKSAATVAVAAVAVTAADRTGAIDVPLPGRADPGAVRATSEPSASTSADPRGDAAAKARAGPGAEAPQDEGKAVAGRPAGGERADSGFQASEHAADPPSARPVSPPGGQTQETGSSPPGGGGKPPAERGDRADEAPDTTRKGRETAAASRPPDTPGSPPQPNEPSPGPPATPPQGGGSPQGKGPPEGKGPPDEAGSPEGNGPPEGKGAF